MGDSVEAASMAYDTRQLLKHAIGRKQHITEIIRLKDGHITTDLPVRVSR
jgi:hypothetical protein